MSDPTRIGIRDARAILPAIVQQAASGSVFVLTFHGNDRCAIVPMEFLAKPKADARKPARRRSK